MKIIRMKMSAKFEKQEQVNNLQKAIDDFIAQLKIIDDKLTLTYNYNKKWYEFWK